MEIEAKLIDIKDGIAKAYERIALRAGYAVYDNTTFDCRYIEVSKEIDDYFWKYYKDEAFKENPNADEEEVKMTIAMLMLQYGAKRNEDLKPWAVKIEEGFVKYDNER